MPGRRRGRQRRGRRWLRGFYRLRLKRFDKDSFTCPATLCPLRNEVRPGRLEGGGSSRDPYLSGPHDARALVSTEEPKSVFPLPQDSVLGKSRGSITPVTVFSLVRRPTRVLHHRTLSKHRISDSVSSLCSCVTKTLCQQVYKDRSRPGKNIL